VTRMLESGAVGVGQSSWGPAVYGVVDGDDAARDLTAVAHDALDGAGTVCSGAFPTSGAIVSREIDRRDA
ncbi:MAG: hypothetical protein K0S86_4744, partial [Geminicoccaceae bacterium]|nr:hypothetical protein [Geminicoccaceae bacterium]